MNKSVSSYHPIEIANVFVSKFSENRQRLYLSDLLKYCYLSQGFSLSKTGNPIIKGLAERWMAGPVFPIIYKEFHTQGIFVKQMASIPPPYSFRINSSKLPDLSSVEKGIIDEIYNKYSNMTSMEFLGVYDKMCRDISLRSSITLYKKIPNKLIRQIFDQELGRSIV